MIELIDVHKRYPLPKGYRTILDGIELRMDAPENIALIGRNGAGKSTLMRIIAGTTAPDRGQVRRTGVYSWPLGFAGSFHNTLSGAENVDFVAEVYGIDAKELRAFVLDFSELGDYFDAPLRTYSSGMRSRLAFGVSMGVEFDVYLIDEVTAVGDQRFRLKCEAVFREKLKKSKIIMISHHDETIKKFCDRAAVLENGQLSPLMPVADALKIHSENMMR